MAWHRWTVALLVLLANASNQFAAKPRLAIVSAICNGTDRFGNNGEIWLLRAESLGQSLDIPENDGVDRVLLMSGFAGAARTGVPHWHRVVDVPSGILDFRTRFVQDPHTPWPFPGSTGKPAVKNRADGRCTTLKFWAWNLTDYDAVLYVDTDVS
jgi:hypothetical protein